MNIFVVSEIPTNCAKFLDDKRVIKMILETTQMLNTSLVVNHGADLSIGYKSTHANHPCTLWVGSNRERFIWTVTLLQALCHEYSVRYNKVHKCEQYISYFLSVASNFKTGELLPFVNCTTDFKHIENTFEAYKMQLNKKWSEDKRQPTWKNK